MWVVADAWHYDDLTIRERLLQLHLGLQRNNSAISTQDIERGASDPSDVLLELGRYETFG